jgi:transcriptional regulator with XRE-family HTH domain
LSYNQDMTDFVLRRPEQMGIALSEFRVLKGLSQAELAASVGLNRTYLSNMERGEIPEYVRRYFSVLDALGLRITITDS